MGCTNDENSSGGNHDDPSDSEDLGTVSGVVRLYNMATQEESTLWPRGDSTALDGSTFGSAVALSSDGRHVIVGAPTWTKSNADGGQVPSAGSIQVFHTDG